MLLIDSDSLIYSTCFACADTSFRTAVNVMDGKIQRILNRFSGMEYVIVISSRAKTFRDAIAVTVPYKGNRKAEKPPHYHEMRDYLLNVWKAYETEDGLEADDFIGIHANKNSIICSIDKDLLMIPCKGHYNFNKDTLKKVTRNIENFWLQMLTGDRSDNIVCISGVGDVIARKLLKGVKLKDMKLLVYSKYVEEFGDKAQDRFHENAQLLWIKRDLNKTYIDYI